MAQLNSESLVKKEALQTKLHGQDTSALQKYQGFFVGSSKLSDFLLYEICATFLNPMPGALGLLLRKAVYPKLFKHVGPGSVWGRNIALRHPGNIEIGDRVAVDDNCVLDAQGAGERGITIGNDVLIARSTLIQGKGSWVSIGNHCVIGSQTLIGSAGGISIGESVMISGNCYIGGGRYKTDVIDKPMRSQALYSNGAIVIDDDVWIGASVTIQDGVHIGRGSVIGAGAVIREDVPEYSVVVPHQKLVVLPRHQT
jgi:acetyltransferase-like isoleucine patch superfamily enzyme